MSSFGDFISLSDVCDVDTAKLIKREVSDGVIAPGYEPEALEILKAKKKGNYNVIQIDPDYVPDPMEHKEVFGITFEQGRNELKIDDDFFAKIVTENKELTEQAKIDLDDFYDHSEIYTVKFCMLCQRTDRQSVSEQDSSPVSTVPRLAGQKADNWWLRQCSAGNESSVCRWNPPCRQR